MDFGRWRARGALVAAGGALLLSGCGGGDDSGDSMSFKGSGHPNVDQANTRDAKGSIDTENVKELEVAWTLPIEGQSTFGSYASSPIVSEGVIYSQDLESNVRAIEQESGEVLWTKSYGSPSHGPNGLVVQDGMVFGATAEAAFGLDQETGKEAWSVPLLRNDKEGIDIAPGYEDGRVYVSTVPVNASEFYGPGGVGILWALDGKTGKKLWSWDTVPKGLWGKPEVNSGGGLWYTPAFDGRGGMYFGVGNPGPFPGTEEEPWGSSRPGPNLYTDSMVKLNSKNGKLQWHHQVTPHALYDWDFQNPPILVKAKGRELAVGSGKSGEVIAFDTGSGDVVWERKVGKHNGHGKDSLYAMRGEFDKLKLPMTVYPGSLGGVISPAATDGQNVYVPVVNAPLEVVTQEERQEPGPIEGELVALDVASGEVQWTHEFPEAPAYGFTTVSNDLVFATTGDGKVSAFDTSSGRLAWEATLPAGTNSGVAIEGDMVIAPAGLPQAEGQTAQLVAYRLGG